MILFWFPLKFWASSGRVTLWPSDSATPKVFSKIIHLPTVARLFSLNSQIWSWDPWDLLAETEPGNSKKCPLKQHQKETCYISKSKANDRPLKQHHFFSGFGFLEDHFFPMNKQNTYEKQTHFRKIQRYLCRTACPVSIHEQRLASNPFWKWSEERGRSPGIVLFQQNQLTSKDPSCFIRWLPKFLKKLHSDMFSWTNIPNLSKIRPLHPWSLTWNPTIGGLEDVFLSIGWFFGSSR